ncbi:ATP-binding protein [Candidatus Woesearchaeota archaeon]|nr:ATP-binding protein [Candidatus Woesearchaeota archaeon]
MLFDLLPKTKKKDLFGVDYAFQTLVDAISDDSTRMVIIKGLRRVGKTSLMNVALNEIPFDGVNIDVRESPYYDQQRFFSYLVEKIRRKVSEPIISQILKKISGVGISYKDISAQLFFSKHENFQFFFENLNKQLLKNDKKIVLAFDEVQLLKEIKFDYILASIFDNYPQIRLVLTGSEIGLLEKFIGKSNYDSPLYGRAYLEIELKRMVPEATEKFLEQGFAQINKKISFGEVRDVVEHLDGIIGWITHYGWLRHEGTLHEEALEKVKREGQELVKREIKQFLNKRKAKLKYLLLLKFLANGNNTWTELKYNFVKEDKKITDNQLNFYLKELLDYGFIEKISEKYYLSDPILLLVAKR